MLRTFSLPRHHPPLTSQLSRSCREAGRSHILQNLSEVNPVQSYVCGDTCGVRCDAEESDSPRREYISAVCPLSPSPRRKTARSFTSPPAMHAPTAFFSCMHDGAAPPLTPLFSVVCSDIRQQ